MIEPKFISCLLEQDLELWVIQICDGDNVSASIFSYVHHEMALGDVQREALFVVLLLLLPQAGAALQHLLQHCGLWHFGGLSDGHFGWGDTKNNEEERKVEVGKKMGCFGVFMEGEKQRKQRKKGLMVIMVSDLVWGK